MPSVTGRSWRSVFRTRSHHTVEASPSASTQEQPPDSDATSITSTHPPSYRSETTITLPTYSDDEDDPTPSAAPRVIETLPWPPQTRSEVKRQFPFTCLPPARPLTLPTLPVPILEEILNLLPISSRLSLKYAHRTLYHCLPATLSSSLLLSDVAFETNPATVRHERALFLAHLETSNLLPRTPTPEKPLPHQTHPHALACRACGLLHPPSAFSPTQLRVSPYHRNCTGSTRHLHLCRHATLPWSAFTREVSNDLHFTVAVHAIRLASYARSCPDLSEREVITRHHRDQCLSWEACDVDRRVPRGTVRFQVHPGFPGLSRLWLYCTWYMDLDLVWRSGRVAEAGHGGRGKVKAPSLPKEIAVDASLENAQQSKQQISPGLDFHPASLNKHDMIAALATRLDELEIYLCPHFDSFHSPYLYTLLDELLTTDFARGPGFSKRCEFCGALVKMYVYEGTGQFWVCVDRVVGGGRSAMDPGWVMSTREPVPWAR